MYCRIFPTRRFSTRYALVPLWMATSITLRRSLQQGSWYTKPLNLRPVSRQTLRIAVQRRQIKTSSFQRQPMIVGAVVKYGTAHSYVRQLVEEREISKTFGKKKSRKSTPRRKSWRYITSHELLAHDSCSSRQSPRLPHGSTIHCCRLCLMNIEEAQQHALRGVKSDQLVVVA